MPLLVHYMQLPFVFLHSCYMRSCAQDRTDMKDRSHYSLQKNRIHLKGWTSFQSRGYTNVPAFSLYMAVDALLYTAALGKAAPKESYALFISVDYNKKAR